MSARGGVIAVAVTALAVGPWTTAAEISFDRDVLPILSNTCFACHGPDAHEEASLRLDSFEAATVDLGGYRAIDPADPEASQLLLRIDSADDPMPPADFEKQLSDEQKQGVLDRDLNRLISLGGNIYYLAKIGATDGMNFAQIVASMTGATAEEHVAMMVAGGRSPEGNRYLHEWEHRS